MKARTAGRINRREAKTANTSTDGPDHGSRIGRSVLRRFATIRGISAINSVPAIASIMTHGLVVQK